MPAIRVNWVCSVPECYNRAVTKQLCDKHYRRLRYSGQTGLLINPAGTGSITKDGYRQIQIKGKAYLQHVLIAEEALGKKLPPGAKIHHVDSNGLNNEPTNLVICPSESYHKLLHSRTRALADKFALYNELREKYFGWEKDFNCDEDDYSFYSDDGRML